MSSPARTSADGPSAASDETQIGVGIGRQVRQARTEKKLSMRALASASEISQPFLSQIESGQTMPSLLTQTTKRRYSTSRRTRELLMHYYLTGPGQQELSRTAVAR